MHLLNMATIFTVLPLLGVEFSVSVFVNPAAWQLPTEAQGKILSRLAVVLGKVMPVWYVLATLLLGVETWLSWHAPERTVLLIVDAIWVLTLAGSILFEVPLNNQVAKGVAGWQQIHRVWDGRNRARIAALAVAAVLLTDVLVR